MSRFADKKIEHQDETGADQSVLKSHGWLAGRSAGFQKDFLAICRPRSFAPREPLYHVGDAPNGIFGVYAGAVALSIPSGDGSNYVATRSGPCFWIGDLALFSNQTRLVGVHAVTTVHALHAPNRDLQAFVDAEPHRYREFYALSHDNMALALNLLSNLSVQDSTRRLGLRLLQRASAELRSGEWMASPQDELAAMIAVSLPTLQRSLKKLSDRGLIEVGYARVRILDHPGLTAFCEA
jgi:CRP-like cAMP-binding protein